MLTDLPRSSTTAPGAVGLAGLQAEKKIRDMLKSAKKHFVPRVKTCLSTSFMLLTLKRLLAQSSYILQPNLTENKPT